MDYPDQDELVMAVIKKIMPYGAFCILPEYNNMEVFLHVSEIAPRWIKNIHEFVSEGQRHVAKVNRIDREKNQVDISLKRVSEEEKKKKLENIRTEKRSEMLLGLAIKNSKVKLSPSDVADALSKEFGDVWTAFTEAMEGKEQALKTVDLPQALKTEIVALAEKNIKKPTVQVSGTVNLVCWGMEGVDDVKKIFSAGEKDLDVNYLGAPRYGLSLSAANYKEGEKKMAKLVEQMRTIAQKNNCDFSFELDKS